MSLSTIISVDRPARAAIDILVLPVTGRSTKELLPAKLARSVDTLVKQQGFSGAWASAAAVAAPTGVKARTVVVVGLGTKETPEREAEALRRGIGVAVGEARRIQAVRIGVALAQSPEIASAAVEAAGLAAYAFTTHSDRLAKRAKQSKLKSVVLLTTKEDQAAVKAASAMAPAILRGITLTRDLINQPANHVAPEHLVAEAKRIAQESPDISVKVLNRTQAAKQGFTAFLSVAQGSDTEPYVIHLTYRSKHSEREVALVGKGITFDSGGLSLKPAEYMEGMKSDMGGAAAVLGTFEVLATTQPNATVHGIIATCENMVSGAAYRPGDVITAKNGKTIEVLNTDAEGRITLADALTYACELEPDVVIDLATLTGACVVALGENIAGLWGTNEDLIDGIQTAAATAGERVETMPMPEEYAAQLESTVADLRNIGTSRYGGAITAALFLKEFVGDTPGAHFDFAAPAYNDRPQVSYIGRGGTGFGVRTLLNYLHTSAE
ncbi:leucyl aminopeptidase [bacterium]|nr:leucyl aminopeptidase [bacterium]